MKALHKTTIVIWSEYDPYDVGYELSDLAREAEQGDAYCSKFDTDYIEDPEIDPNWDDTEFFGDLWGEED